MNALDRIHAVHDLLVQAVDQMVCEGVEMEDVDFGDTLLQSTALSFKRHQVVRVELNAAEPKLKWDEHWRTRVPLIYAAEFALIHAGDKITAAEYDRFKIEKCFRERLAATGHFEWRGMRDDRERLPDGVRFERREIPSATAFQREYEEIIIFRWKTVEWRHS